MERRDESSFMTLHEYLIELKDCRERNKAANRRPRQRRLTPSERDVVLGKTAGRCHICGGEVQHGSWHADHVLAHSAGGKQAVDNYLPAHGICNQYRWDYIAEEFQLILKLGVWARTQVETGTSVGRLIEQGFQKYEARRIGRRKPS